MIKIKNSTYHQIKLRGPSEFDSFNKHRSSASMRAPVQSQRIWAITWRPTSKRLSAADLWGTIRCTVTLRKDSLPLLKVLVVLRKCALGSKSKPNNVLFGRLGPLCRFSDIMVITVCCFQVSWTVVSPSVERIHFWPVYCYCRWRSITFCFDVWCLFIFLI